MKNTATEAKETNSPDDIWISEFSEFEGWKWREAVLFYLNGVWSKHPDVMTRSEFCYPQIDFWKDAAYVCLRLHPSTSTYSGEGLGLSVLPKLTDFLSSEILAVESNGRAEVEQALIRFLRDRSIRYVMLRVPSNNAQFRGSIHLWKEKGNGRAEQLCVASTNLGPTLED